MATPPLLTPSEFNSAQRLRIWTFGIVISDLLIGLLYWGAIALVKAIHSEDWLAVPSCFLIPLFGGFIGSVFWRRLNPGIGSTVLATLAMTFLALIVATVIFHEGVICLLIVSPIFFVIAMTGALLGRLFFKKPTGRLHVSLLPLLAFVTLVEPLARQDEMAAITDEIVIRAPAGRIWPQVTSFPDIPAAPDFWLFRLGLPYPVATTAAGDYVQADRRCIFNGGAVFKEKVAEFEPGKKLTFDILESPPDPELVGHLTPHRGQFVLRDNGDGTTTLIGTTWYTLHVRPAWYFDWWTKHIFRAVHLRVMEDIRRRSEAPL